ncbi:MAG: hypothetical protein HKN45_09555 [Flavobacteriales bacterium]|nr:hypothetical protein [Flavobacteriales bacterium]
MKIAAFLSLTVFLVFAFQSCYYDVEEELYPSQFCDTTMAPSYSFKVVPILDQHCTGCHGGSSPTAGVGLDTYDGVKQSADNGELLCTITHSSGCSPMPDDAPKINACDIIKIDRWIQSGAQND